MILIKQFEFKLYIFSYCDFNMTLIDCILKGLLIKMISIDMILRWF